MVGRLVAAWPPVGLLLVVRASAAADKRPGRSWRPNRPPRCCPTPRWRYRPMTDDDDSTVRPRRIWSWSRPSRRRWATGRCARAAGPATGTHAGDGRCGRRRAPRRSRSAPPDDLDAADERPARPAGRPGRGGGVAGRELVGRPARPRRLGASRRRATERRPGCGVLGLLPDARRCWTGPPRARAPCRSTTPAPDARGSRYRRAVRRFGRVEIERLPRCSTTMQGRRDRHRSTTTARSTIYCADLRDVPTSDRRGRRRGGDLAALQRRARLRRRPAGDALAWAPTGAWPTRPRW